MPLIKSRLALIAALCLAASAAAADPPPAAATAPAPAASVAAAPAAGVITMAQADAIIMKNGFTPVGQPKQKGNIIGSLARLGNNAFIVTVDATTGQFLDAKPTSIALPAMAAVAASGAAASTAAAASAAVTPPATVAVSPVGRAAAIARAQGFTVLSFTHRSDDTFLVARRHGQLFSLKINDKGRLLQAVPVRHREHDDD